MNGHKLGTTCIDGTESLCLAGVGNLFWEAELIQIAEEEGMIFVFLGKGKVWGLLKKLYEVYFKACISVNAWKLYY